MSSIRRSSGNSSSFASSDRRSDLDSLGILNRRTWRGTHTVLTVHLSRDEPRSFAIAFQNREDSPDVSTIRKMVSGTSEPSVPEKTAINRRTSVAVVR